MLKKINIFIIGTIIFLLIAVSFSKARYKQVIEGYGSATIAKPIFEIETEEKIVKEVYKGMKSLDFKFAVLNYNTDLISEIDLEYVIIIKEEEKNFPITYTLLKENGDEVSLENNTSSKILLKGNLKERHNYTLKANWKDKEGELDSSDNIKIEIEAIQKINRK